MKIQSTTIGQIVVCMGNGLHKRLSSLSNLFALDYYLFSYVYLIANVRFEGLKPSSREFTNGGLVKGV